MKKINIRDVVETGVSHNPGIKKKVIIDKGEIPQLMTFGMATFKSGQNVEDHKHDTMYEVFLIKSGRAKFIVSGVDVVLEAGDCLTISPGEVHSQSNQYEKDVVWLYFGIAID